MRHFFDTCHFMNSHTFVSTVGALVVTHKIEICQKIYTTQFSSERILHTENQDYFRQQKTAKMHLYH